MMMNPNEAQRAREASREALTEAERAFAHDPSDERWSAVARARDAFERADVIARVFAPACPGATTREASHG